ncbi:filamentous hemagglutinin family protein, partial [Acinetobacter baumannii]
SFTNTAAIYLFAPRGIIDAGDAGIRASGSAFFIAPVIANLGSITVSGNSNLPAIQVPNFGAITSATNTAGSQRAGDAPTAGGSR